MKILLVEDARAVAALMAARLADFGYEVEQAEDGQIAVEKFRRSPPDLILMDIEMPVMNGFEATNQIRQIEKAEEGAWTPIIFLTGSDTPENMVTAIDAGGDDFLAKSVPEEVLRAKMRALSRLAALRAGLAKANRRLAEMANRDGLTGLYNRRYMDHLTDEAWARALLEPRPFGLLMVDVDNFKRYNDHYGHQAGDDCLRAVAGALARTTIAAGRGWFAARYGGEEFAVVMPFAQAEEVTRLGEQIVAAVRALNIPHEKNADWGSVTISIGGAGTASAQGRIADLFRTADANLYRAKEGGRNRLVAA